MPADDSIFEKALERQMRKRPTEGIDGAAQSEACPNSELLAAYHERSLSDDEMVLWKGHIASCGRCQDVLAALETTEEISLGEREGEFAEVTDAFGSHMDTAAADAAEKIAPLVMRSAAPVSVMSAPGETRSGPYRKRTTRKYWVMAAGTIAAAAVLSVGVATLRRQSLLQTAKTIEPVKVAATAKPGVAEPQLSAQNLPSKDLSTEPMRGVAPSVVQRDQKMPGPAGKVDSDTATTDSLQTGRREDSPKKFKGLAGLASPRGARTNSSGQGAGSGAGRTAGDTAGGSFSAPAPTTPPMRRETDVEDAKKSAAPSANETVVVNEAPPVAIGPASQSVTVTSEKPAVAPSQKKDETVRDGNGGGSAIAVSREGDRWVGGGV